MNLLFVNINIFHSCVYHHYLGILYNINIPITSDEHSHQTAISTVFALNFHFDVQNNINIEFSVNCIAIYVPLYRSRFVKIIKYGMHSAQRVSIYLHNLLNRSNRFPIFSIGSVLVVIYIL